MYRQYPAFFQRMSTLAVLAALCFAMVTSCPVKRLIFDITATNTGTTQQTGHQVSAGSTLNCSIDYTVAHAAVAGVHKSGIKNIAGFSSLVAFLVFSIAVISVLNRHVHRSRRRTTTPVPLFLRNSTFRL